MSFPTCRLKGPLRCWQYRAKDDDAQAIPMWAAALIEINAKELKVHRTNSEWTLDDGDWIVEFAECEDDPLVSVYSAEQFAKQFDIVPDVGAGG